MCLGLDTRVYQNECVLRPTACADGDRHIPSLLIGKLVNRNSIIDGTCSIDQPASYPVLVA